VSNATQILFERTVGEAADKRQNALVCLPVLTALHWRRISCHHLLIEDVAFLLDATQPVDKLPERRVIHLEDRLQTAMSGLRVVVCSLTSIQRAVVNVPHHNRENRLSAAAVPVQTADIIILEPIEHGLQVSTDAIGLISQQIQRSVQQIGRHKGDGNDQSCLQRELCITVVPAAAQ